MRITCIDINIGKKPPISHFSPVVLHTCIPYNSMENTNYGVVICAQGLDMWKRQTLMAIRT